MCIKMFLVLIDSVLVRAGRVSNLYYGRVIKGVFLALHLFGCCELCIARFRIGKKGNMKQEICRKCMIMVAAERAEFILNATCLLPHG
jgi:hypothetical protein